jgi:hypothetical protein
LFCGLFTTLLIHIVLVVRDLNVNLILKVLLVGYRLVEHALIGLLLVLLVDKDLILNIIIAAGCAFFLFRRKNNFVNRERDKKCKKECHESIHIPWP